VTPAELDALRADIDNGEISKGDAVDKLLAHVDELRADLEVSDRAAGQLARELRASRENFNRAAESEVSLNRELNKQRAHVDALAVGHGQIGQAAKEWCIEAQEQRALVVEAAAMFETMLRQKRDLDQIEPAEIKEWLAKVKR
jgi:ABC-type transporter Mla subunit MlaD